MSGSRRRGVWLAVTGVAATTPSSATFRVPTATAIACCASSKTPAGSPPESIMMGRWPADVAVGKELSKIPAFSQFAAGPADGDTVVFAPTASVDPALLKPLMAFGFTIVFLH